MTPPVAADELPGSAGRQVAGVSWRALGTGAHVLVTDAAALPAARSAVETVLAGVDRSLSRFRDDSELSRLNRSGGDVVEASPLLVQALRVALDAAAWTGGLVDPTVGRSLLDLGYDRTFRSVPPDGPAVSVRLEPAPGWQRVELDDGRRLVRLPAGVRLDLGATAKGLAADLAADAAAEACGAGVLVNLGGDLSVAGPAPEGGWPVLVTDDSNARARTVPDQAVPAQTVAVQSGGLATSGVSARRWRRGGSLLHHIVDPRSGLPTGGPWRTASVAGPTCVLANAAATCAMVLGAPAAPWLRERGLAGRLVTAGGEVVSVGGWPS